jgi:hypothetical protein
MFSRNHLLLLCLSCVITVPALAEPTKDDLTGTWYSERKQGEETMKWLSRRMDDNNYAALFLICEGKNVSWVQKERGTWEVADGDLVETMYSKEDMNGPQQAPEGIKTSYTNLDLQEKNLQYIKKGTDKSFNFNRVEDGFQIRCQ